MSQLDTMLGYVFALENYFWRRRAKKKTVFFSKVENGQKIDFKKN